MITASRIRYEITSGNIGGAFAVKNMTGAIYVAGALDYETRKRVSEVSFFITFIYQTCQCFIPIEYEFVCVCTFALVVNFLSTEFRWPIG
jgi:hypothetical protein